MLTITDLKFLPTKGASNSPYFKCNMCGKNFRLTDNSYMADVFISADSHFSFVICSSICVVEFHEPSIRELVN
jgi:hypothetical protein